MEYYQMFTHGDLNNYKLCFIDSAPIGMPRKDYCMTLGLRATKHFPNPAQIMTSSKYKNGPELPGFIGNTPNYLIFNSIGCQIIQKFCVGAKIEYLPFELITSKGKLLSSDYTIVNPIGFYDALNENASKVGTRDKKTGKVSSVIEIVLDPEKLKSAPHLFRLLKDSAIYIISESLINAFKEVKLGNVAHRLLPQKKLEQVDFDFLNSRGDFT